MASKERPSHQHLRKGRCRLWVPCALLEVGLEEVTLMWAQGEEKAL